MNVTSKLLKTSLSLHPAPAKCKIDSLNELMEDLTLEKFRGQSAANTSKAVASAANEAREAVAIVLACKNDCTVLEQTRMIGLGGIPSLPTLLVPARVLCDACETPGVCAMLMA